jgi:hypothetical protein
MKIDKAIKEIEELQSIVNFDYEIDMNIINKNMFDIEQIGYDITDIVNKLKTDEKLLFYLNDGYYSDWNDKIGKYSDIYFIKEYQDSIYYYDKNNYHKCIRIDSDKGSIKKWCKELNKIFIKNN